MASKSTETAQAILALGLPNHIIVRLADYLRQVGLEQIRNPTVSVGWLIGLWLNKKAIYNSITGVQRDRISIMLANHTRKEIGEIMLMLRHHQ